MQGVIGVSTGGNVWAFRYSSGCSKLQAMAAADKLIAMCPDAEIIEMSESKEEIH